MAQCTKPAQEELKSESKNEDDDDSKYVDSVLDDQYYGSTAYLKLIPKHNPKWINAPLLPIASDESFVDFTPSTSSSDVHPYFDEIISAVDQFRKWDSDDTEWKPNSEIKRDDISLSIWTAENGSVTKTQSAFPFSSPVLCGVFCNNEHYTAIDEDILSCKILDQLDGNSYSVFAECNRPFPFSKNPALLMVRFCYVLANGQVLFGETSVQGGLFEADQRTVRAQMTSIWHIEPLSKDSVQSRVTHYCRYKPNTQFLHRKLESKVVLEKAKHLLKLHLYLKEVRKLLHIEGQLYIPTVLLQLLDTSADIVESQDTIVGRPHGGSITAENDHKIFDLNLAMNTAIVDIKQMFKRIKIKK